MAIEIERKFLLLNDSWRAEIQKSYPIQQAYLCGSQQTSVRIRIIGEQAILGIKSSKDGIHRHEYEYSIPLAEAKSMIKNGCNNKVLSKTRHLIKSGNLTWEIDEFHDDNQGLIVAEIELEESDQRFEKPPWLGLEVSTDPKFFNNNLFVHPYNSWEEVN